MEQSYLPYRQRSEDVTDDQGDFQADLVDGVRRLLEVAAALSAPNLPPVAYVALRTLASQLVASVQEILSHAGPD